MGRRDTWCKNYRAMSEHKTCLVGINYDIFRGRPFEERPCWHKCGGCTAAVYPTPEEIAAEEAEINARCEMLGKARQAIVEHLGGPWKRGAPGATGVIDCPVCGGDKTLQFSRSGHNGHIHAKCVIKGCVSWME